MQNDRTRRFVSLKGGPWSGWVLYLDQATSGTLDFTLGRWHGHYDSKGRWIDGA